MKRLWFAVIFLIIAGIMCYGEQAYIGCFYRDISERISTAEAALENNDIKLYESSTRDIEKLWNDKNDFLYAFGEHAKLDGIAVSIRSMPYAGGEEIKELRSLKAQLYAYWENERISLSNVL